MTEDEARQKWCLFARVLDGDPGDVAQHRPPYAAAANRGLTRKADGLCIASDCMAWRWVQEIANQTELDFAMATWPQPRPIYTETDRGYCGLAGRT